MTLSCFSTYDAEKNTLDGVPLSEVARQSLKDAKARLIAQKQTQEATKKALSGLWAFIKALLCTLAAIIAIAVLVANIWLFVGLALLGLLVVLTIKIWYTI